MKKVNLAGIPCLCLTGLLLSGSLLAHAGLSASEPADGAVVNAAPEKLELSFNEDVRLLRVSLSEAGRGTIETGFSPSSAAASEFSLALPALEEGTYTVNWAIMGADSHRVENAFSFTVDAEAAEVSSPAGESHAGHSGH